MKVLKTTCLFALFIATSTCDEQKDDIKTLSRSIGHLIGSSISVISKDLSQESVVEGLQEHFSGKPSPLGDAECAHAIAMLQDKAYQNQANTNLLEAETFLSQNIADKDIHELIPGQLQYKIEKEGKGKTVTDSSRPKIQFVGQFLNGETFHSEHSAKAVDLEDLLPGMMQGIIGMKEGEKRTMFIHPGLALGMSPNTAPNSLLTITCKIIEADCKSSEEEDSSSLTNEILADVI